MKIHDLPTDLCCEHLLCFFNEYRLMRLKMVSKAFANWVSYYLANKKTKYSLHIGDGNHRIGKIIDNFVINLKNLKCIDLYTFDAIDILSLTDVGLCELGRLSGIEELLLKSAINCSGSYIADWILGGSQLLESLRTLTLANVNCEYFHLFKEFKNLKKLELLHEPGNIDENEMDQTMIEFPESLETLIISYPLTHKNMDDITRQCPNLIELKVLSGYFNRETLSLILSRLSKSIQKFKLYDCIYDTPTTGSNYFSLFTPNTFSHLRTLFIFWKMEDIDLQRNLCNLSTSLEKLRVLVTVDADTNHSLDSFLICLSKLSKLTSLHLNFDSHQFHILKEDVLDTLHTSLSLKSLKIVGGFYSDHYERIIKSFIGPHLEKLKWTYQELGNPSESFSFLNDCENIVVLRLNGNQFSVSNLNNNINSLRNCKLEKVFGDSIHAPIIEFLPRNSIKTLGFQVDNSNIKYLHHLNEFTNITHLIFEFGEYIDDFSGCTLPRSLQVLEAKGMLTGTENGFTELLFSACRLKELKFLKCNMKDEFIQAIAPMSEELDILKILYNEGMTEASIEYFAQFTNCRVLLLECFTNRVLSSRFSLFEQDTPRIGIIIQEGTGIDYHKIYPKLDYVNVEEVISYVKERVLSRELREASLTFEQLFYYSTNELSKHPKAEEICKLFLAAFQYDYDFTNNHNTGFEIIDILWKENRITFDERSIYHMEKNLPLIRYKVPFCIVANILIDLGHFTVLFDNFESCLQSLEDLDSYQEEDCIVPLIERVLKQFLDGAQDICSFSGHSVMSTITSIVELFPLHNSILEFIDFVISHDFFKRSIKSMKSLYESRSTIDPFTQPITNQTEPNTKEITSENIVELTKENIPKLMKDNIIHVATVKVPKVGPFITGYFSEPFVEFGYEWIMEFLPVDQDEQPGYCSIFLTLNSTISSNEKNPFDRIRLSFFISNFDLEARSYLVHSRKYDMPESSYGVFLEKKYVEPYSIDEEFLIFKFIVGMKYIETKPFKQVSGIEAFHYGRKELSSTNYPPIIHRMAAEYPISIHTISFRVSPDNIGQYCYSDQFTAFGIKLSACFNALGPNKKVKDSRQNASVYIYLCSTDYYDKPNELESVKFKAVFSNSEFHTDSMYIFKATFSSLTSSGNTVDRKYYQPKLIEIDGKPYYEYVLNCCLALINVHKQHPHLYEEEISEEEEYEGNDDEISESEQN